MLRSMLLSAVVMSLTCQSVFATQLKVSTYNINYSRTAENEWKWNGRKQRVFGIVELLTSDVLALQELVDNSNSAIDDKEVSYKHMKAYLEENGYVVYAAPFQNERKLEQFLFTALRKNTFADSQVESKVYDVKDFTTENKETGVLGTVQATALDYDSHSILTLNHHFPMKTEARFATANALKAIAQQAAKDLFHDVNFKDIKIIHLGDFNSFPDDKGPEQIELITASNVLVDIGAAAKYSNTEVPVNGREAGDSALFTFVGFPHDVDRMAKSNIQLGQDPGHLDHILVSKNITPLKVEVVNADPLRVTYEFKFSKNYPDNFYTIFPSDHLPLTAVLEF